MSFRPPIFGLGPLLINLDKRWGQIILSTGTLALIAALLFTGGSVPEPLWVAFGAIIGWYFRTATNSTTGRPPPF